MPSLKWSAFPLDQCLLLLSMPWVACEMVTAYPIISCCRHPLWPCKKNTEWKLKAANVQCLSLPQPCLNTRTQVSNKKLINKSTQMCAQNPSRGYLSANLLCKAYPRLCLVFSCISPLFIFYFCVCMRVSVCMCVYGEQGRDLLSVSAWLGRNWSCVCISRLPVDEMGIYNAPTDGSDLAI